MANKRQIDQDRRRRKWGTINKTLLDFRKKAPAWKVVLRHRGYKLPFYDYLDSWADEFAHTVQWALQNYSSLIGIHEVDAETYYGDSLTLLGYGGYKREPIEFDDSVGEYSKDVKGANVTGKTNFLREQDGRLRSVIMVHKAPKGIDHREFRYLTKLAALWHEIGHVHDAENQINFRFGGAQTDLIEAEVFANLFAFEKLAGRSLVQSFKALESGIKDLGSVLGLLGEVSRRVMARLPAYNLVDWSESAKVPPTDQEIKVLGPRLTRLLQLPTE